VARNLLLHEIKRRAILFLEVRESNVAAIQLYKNAGFMEISRRRDYYDNPVESAIVMRLKW
jgi:ribosomal-protein-alanine N-acetyltransferase